jgi:hypothetical protein
MGKAVFRLTAADVVEAFQALYGRALRDWRSIVWLLLFAVTLIVVLSFMMVGLGAPPRPVTGLAVGLSVLGLITAYLVLSHLLLVPAAARRFHDSSRGYQGEIEARWDQDGVAMTSATGTTMALWRDFVGWQETPRFLLLIPRPGHANMVLPKAALGSGGVSTILAHLARHNVRRAGRTRA